MVKYYIGIDNGVKGGISVLDSEYNIVEKIVMPVFGTSKKEYDLNKISKFLKKYNDCFIILEKAQPQFRDGKKQAFKTGFGYGAIQGILSSLQLSYIIVSAKEWQKKVFAGLCVDDTKIASILFCQRQWPLEDWTATKQSQKEHDGLTDASCLAYYGLITR